MVTAVTERIMSQVQAVETRSLLRVTELTLCNRVRRLGVESLPLENREGSAEVFLYTL